MPTGARVNRRGAATGRPSTTRDATDDRVGDAEQRPHVVLAPHRHGGHDPAEALGPCREQQAPDERVDGGAAGEGVAGQVAVDRGERRQVGQDEEEGGRGIEGLGETGWCGRRRLGELRRVGDGRRLGGAVGDRCPGHQTGRRHRQVLVPTAQVEITQRRAGGRVLDHDDAPALTVAAAGSEAGRVEEAGQDVVADRLGEELADGAGAAQGVDEVQVHRLPTVAAGG